MSKKGTKNQKELSSYELRDVVLGKVRGYPPWPGMIVDPETVPETVQKERPSNKKATWYCVRFFPSGDYAWLVSKDISKLKKHEIEAYINEPYKKSGDLLSGYQVALDPTKWEEERNAAAMEAEEETANAQVDQLASEDEGGDKPSKSKKRKRESETVSSGKSKPKPKGKKDSGEVTGKKKSLSVTAKKSGSKSKALVESEDDGEHEGEDDDVGPSKKAVQPPAKKSKKDKDGDDDVDPAVANDPEARKVREWRHQLQKAFLSLKAQPKDEDMPAIDALFTAIEQFDRMSIACLQFSKIGKVMRHITALPPEKLPRDNDFNFKQRAVALVDRWHQILSANKSNGNADDNPATAAAKEDADKEDGVKEDGAKEDGTKEDGAKEEALSPKVNGASGDATTAGQTDATAEPAVAVQSDEQMRQA